MSTNHSIFLIRLLLIFFLGISITVHAKQNVKEGKVINLKKDNKEVTSNPNVIITRANGAITEGITKDKTKLQKGDVIKIPDDVEVWIEVVDKENTLKIKGEKTIVFGISKFRVLAGKFGSWLSARFKKSFGKVLVSNPNNSKSLATRKTEFIVEVDQDSTTFKLIEGVVSINERKKILFRDDELEKIGALSIDGLAGKNDYNRSLFVTEISQFLDINNDIDTLQTSHEEFLNSETAVDSFFNKQLIAHKKRIRRSGYYSKKGFTKLNRGDLNNGKILFENAIAEEEITIEELIQSSLLITEGYFRNKDLDQRKAWLDTAIHFIKIADSLSREKKEYFMKNHDPELANVYLNDEIQTNEYFSWGYTVKLLINGCLESPNEDPRKYIREARRLKNQLKKLNN
ncbi:hypothetical protein U0L90_14425 [Flavobacteriaceae sp. LMIT009]